MATQDEVQENSISRMRNHRSIFETPSTREKFGNAALFLRFTKTKLLKNVLQPEEFENLGFVF